MSDSEKIAFIQQLIDDVAATPEMISAYLNLAAGRILERLYPFGEKPIRLPNQFDIIQCELVVRMLARRGGEGEISHAENGVTRTYISVDDEDILQRLTPFVGVI
nr:MAG TPA: tail connector protein [Caudoviricetes sp.]